MAAGRCRIVALPRCPGLSVTNTVPCRVRVSEFGAVLGCVSVVSFNIFAETGPKCFLKAKSWRTRVQEDGLMYLAESLRLVVCVGVPPDNFVSKILFAENFIEDHL